MQANTRLIKKYKNRRLYDTSISQYIIADDLQRYVIEGVSFRVEDSVSHADITNATLLQIFVEMEAGSTRFFSSDMLRQLIILAHHPLNHAFKTMMEQAMTSLEKQSSIDSITMNYQQAQDAWNKHAETLLNHWHDFFKR